MFTRRLASLFLLLLSATPLRAETPSEIPNPLQQRRSWVADNADVISDEEEKRINGVLSPLERRTGAEIAVVTVKNLGGQSVEEFANELFRLWKIGKKDKDNGVVILVSIGDRKSRIDVDYGLQDVITDGQAGEILRSQVTPAFKRGAYGAGIVAGVNAVARKIDPALPIPTPSNGLTVERNQGSAPSPGTSTTEGFPEQGPVVPANGSPSSGSPSTGSPTSGSPGSSSWGTSDTFYLLFGLFLLALPGLFILGIIWFIFSLFRRPPSCPRCKTRMVLVPEHLDDALLNPAQQFEERLGSVDYRVWRCPQCHAETISRHEKFLSDLSLCPRCHNKTARTSRRMIKRPTQRREGLEETSTACELPGCGYTSTHQRTIARVSPPSSSDYATGAAIGSIFGSSSGSSSGSWGDSNSSSSSSASSSYDSGPSDFGGSDSGGGGGGASDSW